VSLSRIKLLLQPPSSSSSSSLFLLLLLSYLIALIDLAPDRVAPPFFAGIRRGTRELATPSVSERVWFMLGFRV